jgi:Mg-chelatase subunit ChlI
VLIRGERGTAKSTAARALAALLPLLGIVQGCRFNCDPQRPDLFCDECRERLAQGGDLSVSHAATPLSTCPSAPPKTRVVGTLDIEKAIQKGERHFEPGILAAANRGVLLLVDEVNLLDDHVVRFAARQRRHGGQRGRTRGDRASNAQPALVLVGSMNPEEGDLRAQLLRPALPTLLDVVGITEAALPRSKCCAAGSSSSRTPMPSGTAYDEY